MPRIFVDEHNRLWQGSNDEGVYENYDYCNNCFNELEQGVDYCESSNEAADVIIEHYENDYPHTCEKCGLVLKKETYISD